MHLILSASDLYIYKGVRLFEVDLCLGGSCALGQGLWWVAMSKSLETPDIDAFFSTWCKVVNRSTITKKERKTKKVQKVTI